MVRRGSQWLIYKIDGIGEVRHGAAWHGMAWLGEGANGSFKIYGSVWLGEVRSGLARRGAAWEPMAHKNQKGEVRSGRARSGLAGQGMGANGSLQYTVR